MKTISRRMNAIFAAAMSFGVQTCVSTATDLSVGQLTVAQDAMFLNDTFFGQLIDGTGDPGFSVHVEQTSEDVEVPVWVEGYSTSHMVEVFDYGEVQSGYWSDVYGDVQIEVWIDPVVDTEGNELYPGYISYETRYQWMGSEYVDLGMVWSQIGSHTEYVTEDVEGHEVLQWETQFSAPTVQFTANRSNTAWVWENPSAAGSGYTRQLMKLTPAGLYFPAPYETGSLHRAILNDKAFTISNMTSVADDVDRTVEGSSLEQKGFETWAESGGAPQDGEHLVSPAVKQTSKLTPAALSIGRSYVDPATGTNVTSTTQIGSSHANFAGNVNVKGVLRVLPAGELSMGQYVNGETP